MFGKKVNTQKKTMAQKVYDLVKNDAFYDDDLQVWVDSHDFEDLNLVARDGNVLILIYADKMETLDLDTLDMFGYKYELQEETTII